MLGAARAGQTGTMPEGDTIHRTAARLKPVLAGTRVKAFRAPRLVERGPAPGTPILDVEAVGKYLLVHFGDGSSLETHMKMSGSWHAYRSGERWRRSPGAARAVIETDGGWVAVCFAAPHVKLTRGGTGPSHLGPDLCTEAPDLAAAAARFDVCDPATPAAVALLDQRVCCGVGNVYKSEVLFACGLHPETPVGAIDRELRLRLVTTAHELLRRNLGGGPRTTTRPGAPGALAVYDRTGRPCHTCGQPITSAIHGVHARRTWWCPACQPMAAENP